MRSLVVSRLLYNAQTLTMTVAGLRRQNLPCMRSWRCIIGESRVSALESVRFRSAAGSWYAIGRFRGVAETMCVLQPAGAAATRNAFGRYCKQSGVDGICRTHAKCEEISW